MRLLVCGSRHYADVDAVHRAIVSELPDVLIHGAAPGADSIAGDIALLLDVPVIEAYPAWWGFLPRNVAGPDRNQRMLDQGKPDRVVAFPLADSRGTWNMVRKAIAARVSVAIPDVFS